MVRRVAVPLRAWLQRFTLLALAAAAVALMALGRANSPAVERLRGSAIDVFAPLLGSLSRPVEAVRQLADETGRLLAVHRENARLREENARLKRWEIAARRLQHDNAALRGLLNLRIEPQPAFVSARVIGDSNSAFVRTMLLDVGRRDGVDRGQAAITSEGLAGRIVEVGERSARLLLVTDLNSRIPVLVESSRHRAILAGDNSERARLDFLPQNARVALGDRIVTSGHDGVFPPGLPVGVVSEASDSAVRVRPLVEASRLEYVRVLDWPEPQGALPPSTVAGIGPAPRRPEPGALP